MQPGFQVLYCIGKLQINGIARYYVSGGGGGGRNIHKFEYVSKPVYCEVFSVIQMLFVNTDKSRDNTRLEYLQKESIVEPRYKEVGYNKTLL